MSDLPRHLLGLSKGDLEGMCVDCGLCCYASVSLEKGSVLVPELRCKHLSFDAGKSCCDVYETRHEVMKGYCLPLAEAIKSNVFPKECPYVKDMDDYLGAAILSDQAYKAIRPQIQKALQQEGRPVWASDSLWAEFTKA